MLLLFFALSCAELDPAEAGRVLVPEETRFVEPTEAPLGIETSENATELGPHTCPIVLGTPVDGGWNADAPALPDSPLVGPDATPSRIHLAYGQNAASELIFTWETGLGGVGSRVEIGQQPGIAEHSLIGASFELSNKRIHVVRACGLSAASTWYYRVGGSGAWSAEAAVTTAPTAATDTVVRFALSGDSRGSPSTWGTVAGAAAAAGAEFIVFTGDAVASGTNLDEWDEWFDAAAEPLRSLPLAFVQGNHEANDQYFYGLFPTSTLEASFGLDYGPIHFSMLSDTAYGEWNAAAMAAWLGTDLASTTAPWKIVAYHRPAVSSSNPHGEDATNKQYILPVVDAAGVRLVFNGHAHNYERSVPVRASVPTDGGAVHIVSGGAGAPLYTGSYGRSYTAVETKTEHWVLFEVSSTRAVGTAYDLAGNVIDSFTLDL